MQGVRWRAHAKYVTKWEGMMLRLMTAAFLVGAAFGRRSRRPPPPAIELDAFESLRQSILKEVNHAIAENDGLRAENALAELLRVLPSAQAHVLRSLPADRLLDAHALWSMREAAFLDIDTRVAMQRRLASLVERTESREEVDLYTTLANRIGLVFGLASRADEAWMSPCRPVDDEIPVEPVC